MWEIWEVLNMKVREFTVQAWDRYGSEVHKSKSRDRVHALHEVDLLTSRSDLDIAAVRVQIKIVDQNDT